MSKIEDYYTNIYNEDYRLSEKCDNRHKVEIINKSWLIDHYINKFINLGHEKLNILDVGAGTGIWTEYIISKYPSCNIICGDIVAKHNEILKKRFSGTGNVEVFPMDACDLNVSIDENDGLMLVSGENKLTVDRRFDLVLCGGPLYHCDEESKIIDNLFSVTRNYGHILIDWLSEFSGVLNWSIMKGTPITNIEHVDEIFHYTTSERLDDTISRYYCYREHFGIDSVTRFIQDEVNTYNENELKKYCENIRIYWKNNSNSSEHSITAITKIDRNKIQ